MENSKFGFYSKPDVSKIDTSNNEQMINEGLRNPFIEIDRSEFSKSEDERKLLNRLRKSCTKLSRGHMRINNKLYTYKVHVKNNGISDSTVPKEQQKRYFKTTYVFNEVTESEISMIKNYFKYRKKLEIVKEFIK